MSKPHLLEKDSPGNSTGLGAKTIQKFEKDWGVGHTTVYKEVKLGRLKTVKVGRRTLILAEDERAYADLLRSEAA